MIVGVFSQNVLFQYNTKHLKDTGGGAKSFTDFLCIENTTLTERHVTKSPEKIVEKISFIR